MSGHFRTVETWRSVLAFGTVAVFLQALVRGIRPVDGSMLGHFARNSPVLPPRASCDSLPLWHRPFGWSLMIDGIARRQRWTADWIFDNVRALPEGAGRELACPVIGRLATLVRALPTVHRGCWRTSGANGKPRQ